MPRSGAAGRGAARGAARAARRRPRPLEPRDILVMCPDIEAYAPLIRPPSAWGRPSAGGHPGHAAAGAAGRPCAHPDQPAARRGRQAARPRRWPRRGQRGARPARRGTRTPPLRVRRERPRDHHRWVEQAGRPLVLRRAAPVAVRAGGLRPEHLALRPRPGARGGGDVRRRRALVRYDAAARRRRVSTSIDLAGRLAELRRPAAARHRPAHRQPPGRPLAGHAARGDRVSSPPSRAATSGRPARCTASWAGCPTTPLDRGPSSSCACPTYAR